MWSREASEGLARILIAVFLGLLVSWLGVAALITLVILWPHNPVPLILLVAWAVLVLVLLVNPGSSGRTIRAESPALILMALPFLPIAGSALVIWPHLPSVVQELLEGSFRSRRRARQRERSRLSNPAEPRRSRPG